MHNSKSSSKNDPKITFLKILWIDSVLVHENLPKRTTIFSFLCTNFTRLTKYTLFIGAHLHIAVVKHRGTTFCCFNSLLNRQNLTHRRMLTFPPLFFVKFVPGIRGPIVPPCTPCPQKTVTLYTLPANNVGF